LLLQGGGALGAYQAGVYQALAEADLHPDWVAGISIGAINSAIIAGNPPEERVAKLRTFWEGITTNPLFDWTAAADQFTPKGNIARSFFNQMSAAWALVGGAPGFFTLRQPGPWRNRPAASKRRAFTRPSSSRRRWNNSSTSNASIRVECASPLAR
jgi:NTE family protein